MRWGCIACVAIFACAEEPNNLGLGSTDGGLAADASLTTDADVDPFDAASARGIRLLRLDGQPADGALVYALEDNRGQRLGRADSRGFFSLPPETEFLARNQFDQVILGTSPAEGVAAIRLESTNDHPETLQLLGVGMQMQIPELITNAWPQRQGGFLFTTFSERGLEIWQWTAALGSRLVVNYPNFRGVGLRAFQASEDLWVFVEGPEGITSVQVVMLIDTVRNTAERIEGLELGALSAGPVVAAHNNEVLFFEPGDRLRIHRLNRGTFDLIVTEVANSGELEFLLLKTDGVVWFTDTQRAFSRLDLDTFVASKIANRAPGSIAVFSPLVANDDFWAVSIDAPRAHWWTTQAAGYVSFDVGAFESMRTRVSVDPPGAFLSLRNSDGPVRHVWLDVGSENVVALDELDRRFPSSNRASWGSLARRDGAAEVTRKDGETTILVRVDNQGVVSYEDDLWGQPSACIGSDERPRTLECRIDEERWMVTEHDGQWLRRTFFRTVRGPIVESGRHVLVASFRDGFQTVFDADAEP